MPKTRSTKASTGESKVGKTQTTAESQKRKLEGETNSSSAKKRNTRKQKLVENDDTIEEKKISLLPRKARKLDSSIKVEPASFTEITNVSSSAGDISSAKKTCVVTKCEQGYIDKPDVFLGAHVSIQGGLEKAFDNARAIGARSFACFLRSSRKWESKPLTEEAVGAFRKAKESDISADRIVPHGSYLLNCGSPNDETLAKSRKVLTEELQVCDRLGLTLYNFHPGSTCGLIDREECIRKISESINMAHEASSGVVVLLENMSKQGHTIGGEFSELASIISKVTDQSRVGVCLDTCHAHAAGWDLSSAKGCSSLFAEVEATVGLNRVLAVHLNDSKGKTGCHLDRHEDLGRGSIGWAGLLRVVSHPGLRGRPVVLETPGWTDYAAQIREMYKRVMQSGS